MTHDASTLRHESLNQQLNGTSTASTTVVLLLLLNGTYLGEVPRNLVRYFL